jgi:hypothetical protein
MANIFNQAKGALQNEASTLINNAKDVVNNVVNKVEGLFGAGKGAAGAAMGQAGAAADAAKGAANAAMGQVNGAVDAAKGQASAAADKAKGAAGQLSGLFSKVPKLVDTPKVEARELPTPKKYVKSKLSTLATSNAGDIKIQGADIKAAKMAGSLTSDKEAAIKAAKESSHRFMKKQKDGTSRWIYAYPDSPTGYIYGDGTNVNKED